MGGTAWRAPISCVSLKDGGGGAIWAIDCHLRRLTPWALCRARYARIFSRLYLRTGRGGGTAPAAASVPRKASGGGTGRTRAPSPASPSSPRAAPCAVRFSPDTSARPRPRPWPPLWPWPPPCQTSPKTPSPPPPRKRKRRRPGPRGACARAPPAGAGAAGRRGQCMSPACGEAGRTSFSFCSSRLKRCCSLLRWS